ncbi:MAG: hypothetical protein ACLSD3_04445 [Acutalibacteraceae bacterium]
MKKTLKARYLPSDRIKSIAVDSVKKCPLCHSVHSGTVLNAYLLDKTIQSGFHSFDYEFLYVVHLCEACDSIFIGIYSSEKEMYGDQPFEFYSAFPSTSERKEFDERILKMSPRFVEIYNQSQKAEQSELTEICGMGYRKALECLIKDYLLNVKKMGEEEVLSMQLGACIANKVDNPLIKKVAQKCAWLGNDFSHYVNKHNEGIETLKALIDATVYWICMECVTAESDLISRK